jgi:hypothetical protein
MRQLKFSIDFRIILIANDAMEDNSKTIGVAQVAALIPKIIIPSFQI